MTEVPVKIFGERLEIPVVGGSLAALVHLPQSLPAPTVICCHGLLSSKDSGKFAAICDELCRAGFAAVRFDFSGCGETRTDFEPTLLATRRRDLTAVMTYVQCQAWTSGELGLLGSSMGGYLALLTAADLAAVPVQAVVCWATPFDLARVRLALARDGSFAGLPAPFRHQGEPENLGALPPVSRVLIIQGQMDGTVDWQEAVQIYRRMADPKQLLLFETADHRFLDPACRQSAIKASVDWFLSHLSRTT
jgi:alpha-beta hydrolase superfamily lysophospholipase